MPEKHRPRLIWRLAAIALFLSIWIAWTQSQQAPASLALQKIKDDLYVIALSKGVGGGNIAVYLTDDGVIVPPNPVPAAQTARPQPPEKQPPKNPSYKKKRGEN